MVFMPFCFAESPANRLTNPKLDPFGKIPEFKYCAARVERSPTRPRGGDWRPRTSRAAHRARGLERQRQDDVAREAPPGADRARPQRLDAEARAPRLRRRSARQGLAHASPGRRARGADLERAALGADARASRRGRADVGASSCRTSRPSISSSSKGSRRESHAKLEVHRSAVGKPLLYPNDPNIVAIASDRRPPNVALPFADLERHRSDRRSRRRARAAVSMSARRRRSWASCSRAGAPFASAARKPSRCSRAGRCSSGPRSGCAPCARAWRQRAAGDRGGGRGQSARAADALRRGGRCVGTAGRREGRT